MTSFFPRNHLRRTLRLSGIVAATWMLAGAAAQDQRVPAMAVVGELRSRNATFWGDLIIQLDPVIGGSFVGRADVRPDGSFQFRDIPPGTYQISIRDYRGNVIWSDLTAVMAGRGPLAIEVDSRPLETSRASTVSIARLRQKPSPAALREMRLAQKALDQRAFEDSIGHLRRVIELAPDLADAHNDLGAAYLRSESFELARHELETAVALDPDAPIPHANLALALLALGRPGEAEDEARKALRRDPLSPAANYAAGAALELKANSAEEAVRFLDRAAERIPQALLMEARILQARSRTAEAAEKLRSYLARRGVSQRSQVAKWLETMTAASAKRP